MAKYVVRPYEERDSEAYFAARAVTYNNGRPYTPEERVFKRTRGFVGEVDGEVAGAYNVLDLTCTRGEATLKCGGIAGVAVRPEKRNSGVGHQMMSWAVRDFRKGGIPMASLYGFRESYYRKFGYEVCGRRFKITCPNHRFPKVASGLELRTIPWSDWALLNGCYGAFARSHAGMSLRDDKLWGRVIDENKIVYVAGDPVEAYAIVSHDWAFWAEQSIQECGWSSLRGHEALMELFRSIGVNKTSVSWYEPTDSPFMTRFWDQGVSFEPVRAIMYRVTDVPAALCLLHPLVDGSFTLSVDDEVIPENRGPWLVTSASGVVTVQPCASASLSLSIQSFTQAFLGEPSLERLVALGLVTSSSEAELGSALRLLPALPVYCMEFF